jgi:hypothetical protein
VSVPDVRGSLGAAWRSRPTSAVRASWPAVLDSWLLHAPNAHPFWSWYVVSTCSLRDVAGMPPATKETRDSSHELVLYALNPFAGRPDPTWLELGADSRPRWAKHLLQPQNLQVHLEHLDDVEMDIVTELFVVGCCNGLCSPDSDHQRRNRSALASYAERLRNAGPVLRELLRKR